MMKVITKVKGNWLKIICYDNRDSSILCGGDLFTLGSGGDYLMLNSGED